ncbi:MAG: M4 family metallopeptidase [Vicingaceae bacterium]
MRILFTLTAILSGFILFAQDSKIEIVKERKAVKEYLLPDYLQFSESSQPSLAEASEIWQSYFKGKPEFDLKLIREEEDQLEFRHLSYQQTFQNIPLAFSSLKLHLKEGKVKAINGRWINKAPKSSNQTLTEAEALKAALDYVSAKTYKWEIPAEEENLKAFENDADASYFPEATMVYASPKASLNPEEMSLCYRFNIYAHQPMSRKEIYISAADGSVVFVNDLIHTGNEIGSAQTGYSGVQSITTDSLSPTQFRLQQTASGNGIRTFDLNNATTYGGAVDFIDADNNWNNVNPQLDQYATDAHWGAESTYDYFLNEHNRNSINNAGFPLVSYVHYDNNYANAFWNGQYMTYGDGNGPITPLTSLDIAGHEIAHGLTTFSANLIYQSESGALNESFSDIFGAAIEFYARPNNANWTIGEDIGTTIRSMSNPNAFGDPDTRNGNNWLNVVGCVPSQQNDNCGVHINSGVQNYWFYLLSTGRSGTNDLGNAYSVSSIGITKAAKIAFRNLTVYLGRNSNYDDARFYSILSAVDLYGPCSPEVEAVTNAWHAVGVGNAYQAGVNAEFLAADSTACAPPHTVNFSNTSSNGLNFVWDFGDGTTSTQLNPTKVYQNYGQYDVKLIVDGGTCGRDSIEKINYIKVDTSYLCTALLEDGFNPTQLGCNGKLFDSGGAGGNYSNMEQGIITIAPTNASSITLTFNYFDVEAGSGNVCDYDYLEVYDGVNIAAPLIGKYCNTTGAPAPITSSGGAITLRFYSDQALTEGGFDISWNCNFPSTSPSVEFDVSSDSSCIGMFQFTDRSTQNPTSWSWDFGDGNISNLQNPTHQYQQNGSYTVKLVSANSFGTDSITKTNRVFVNRPVTPQLANDTACLGQSVSLTSSASGTINWYTQPVGGMIVATGPSYTTPPINQDVSFYAENYVSSPLLNVGPANNNFGTGGFGSFDRHLVFDVFRPLILQSVTAYANSSGNRLIELRDNSGNVIQSTSAFLTLGMNVINLNFDLPAGTDFQLGLPANGIIDLYRTNSGLSYPYTIPGYLNIKSSNASVPTGFYYYFYDWKVKEEDCYSSREEVFIKADSSCSITATKDLKEVENTLSIYPNPSDGAFTLTFDQDVSFEDYGLFNIAGKSIPVSLDSRSGKQFNLELNNLPNGIYFLQLKTQEKLIRKKISIVK